MISAIVPARDEEASIARVVESLEAQPDVREIIVVNDGSTDSTGSILAELAVRISSLRVLETSGLPEGWIGKNYAVTVGARAAHGDWLLFVDADTVLEPGAVCHALSDARENSAALVSYSPEQEMKTLGEDILIPFVYTRLAEHFSFDRINDPRLPDAAANGQFLMIRRDVYESLGGHAAIRSRILEDVALARLVKSSGHNIHFASGRGIARTRMYRSFAAMWQGWTKNLYELLGGTPGAIVRELLETFPWLEITLLVLGILEARRGHWLVLIAAALVLLGRHIRYAYSLRRNRLPLSVIQYYIPAAIVYGAVLVASYWKTAHGSVAWKGRKYPAGAP
ncbi:MAG: glycosyltransferase [Candidatus Acidiferrales bacterium]|jgi:glycosyltransferase involved in cell wall biosynthesis